MNQIIQPRTLQGFRDYLPETMMPREKLMETARRVYRSYGFCPIDTPSIELLEILLAKAARKPTVRFIALKTQAVDRSVCDST